MISGFSSRLPDALQELGLFLGLALASLGAITFFWHALNEVRLKRGKGKLTVEPSTLLPVFAVIALIGVIGVVGCLVWERRAAAADQSSQIRNMGSPPQADQSALAGGMTELALVKKRLAETEGALSESRAREQELSAKKKDVPQYSIDAARFIQLSKGISKAKSVRETLEKFGLLKRDNLHTQQPMRSSVFFSPWQNAVSTLKEVQSAVYPNDPAFDADSAPELANPLQEAPGEATYSDPKQRYEYRTFHFVMVNVIKRADALIEKMERELKNTEARVAANKEIYKALIDAK